MNNVPTGHFSVEESSYVAVMQSRSVPHVRCKSSAKFCSGSKSPLRRSRLWHILSMFKCVFSGSTYTETFGEPEGEGENKKANLIAGLALIERSLHGIAEDCKRYEVTNAGAAYRIEVHQGGRVRLPGAFPASCHGTSGSIVQPAHNVSIAFCASY